MARPLARTEIAPRRGSGLLRRRGVTPHLSTKAFRKKDKAASKEKLASIAAMTYPSRSFHHRLPFMPPSRLTAAESADPRAEPYATLARRRGALNRLCLTIVPAGLACALLILACPAPAQQPPAVAS